MLRNPKVFSKMIVICFVSIIAGLHAKSALPKKDSCGPITIEDYFSPKNYFQKGVKDLFGNLFSELENLPNFGLINRFPFLSISETENTVVVKAELPGLDENEVKIDIHRNHLIISGEKKDETLGDQKSTCHICELTYGKFSRNIVLPFETEANKIEASFDKGVLTITIQKPAEKVAPTQSVPIKVEGKKT